MNTEYLAEAGSDMFGRREDANCILTVGPRKYYVHAQVLVPRSFTFRHIFEEMMVNGAWGSLSETNPSDNGDEDTMGHSIGQGSQTNIAKAPINPAMDCSCEGTIQDIVDNLRIEGETFDNSDDDTNEEDVDECLPELALTLMNPEGSCFEELLYWLYTGDAERWLRSFTPENYSSILSNVELLRLTTGDALEVCHFYKAKLDSHLGLKQMD
ncbi:hypothetical protein BGZ76_002131 [Entomortierella beljakovae]|nr:hypothetical protein BGZ76_002131 [Entomortierella beljakovae]